MGFIADPIGWLVGWFLHPSERDCRVVAPRNDNTV